MAQVYHTQAIQAWEKDWFKAGNSAYGLMQQVAWQISQHIIQLCQQQQWGSIAVCCGFGNNAGDGYLIAKYLHQAGLTVDVYADQSIAMSDLTQQARLEAEQADVNYIEGFSFQQHYQVYIDALFGIGLNRQLSDTWQNIITQMNARQGIKIAIDIPSGLAANTGRALPCAIVADYTYTVLGLKIGLLTGHGRAYSGQIKLIDLLPTPQDIAPLARLSIPNLRLPKRQAFGHKGSYGHVLVIGGHAQMGGAVILAAEASFAAGAGKVTVVCDARHHAAILARSPNIMLRDINSMTAQDRHELIAQVDAIAFGMGLGRDDWAKVQYHAWWSSLHNVQQALVMDADALWFLSQTQSKLNQNSYATPHPGEAATLLECGTADVEADRVAAIYQLANRYGGHWVLKGSGSLILEQQLWVCAAGNPGMATGGMGDVLAGMIASLKAQFSDQIALHQIVTLHAQAGDHLAQSGQRGLQAQQMSQAIYQVVNGAFLCNKDFI